MKELDGKTSISDDKTEVQNYGTVINNELAYLKDLLIIRHIYQINKFVNSIIALSAYLFFRASSGFTPKVPFSSFGYAFCSQKHRFVAFIVDEVSSTHAYDGVVSRHGASSETT